MNYVNHREVFFISLLFLVAVFDCFECSLCELCKLHIVCLPIKGEPEVSAFAPLSLSTAWLWISPGKVTLRGCGCAHCTCLCAPPSSGVHTGPGGPDTMPSPVCVCGKSQVFGNIGLCDAIQETQTRVPQKTLLIAQV